MLGNPLARHKTFLVRVEFGYSPGGEAVVDQVSVHFAVTIHGGDRSVVSNKSGVTLLVEKAQVSILEVEAVSAT